MRRLLFPLVLAVTCLAGPAALAGSKNKVQDYQETEMTDEERQAAQSRGRHRVSSWQETTELPQADRPFPWMAVGLGVGLLAIAAPFAWGAYKRTSQELKDADAFGAQPRRTRTKG
ncbi:MAG: hypothetical protein AMXMBFR34_25610 [Myxococcaceae bacterium]